MQSFAYSSKWMAVTLSSDGLITSLGSSAEQFTGYSPQELVGRPITQILADRSIFEVPQMLEIAREWWHWDGEIVHRTRGGKSIEARSTLSVLTGHGNHVSGFLLISNFDKSVMPGEQKDTVLGEVAAKLRVFAHELNNPLAVMMGFAQLLTLNASCHGKMRSDIEKLCSEMKRVIHVVEKLHAYAIALCEKPRQDQVVGAEDFRGGPTAEKDSVQSPESALTRVPS